MLGRVKHLSYEKKRIIILYYRGASLVVYGKNYILTMNILNLIKLS